MFLFLFDSDFTPGKFTPYFKKIYLNLKKKSYLWHKNQELSKFVIVPLILIGLYVGFNNDTLVRNKILVTLRLGIKELMKTELILDAEEQPTSKSQNCLHFNQLAELNTTQ